MRLRGLWCKTKKGLLALYNAVNGTSYTNLDDLEITTLENAIYMSMNNDVSFVVDMVLSLYEHQSTVNPNLPLRDLDYVSDFLKKNKEQVISMSIFEYDEKLHEETMKEIGREEGRAEERTTGINKLVSSLRKLNTSDNDIILALIEQYELSDSEAKGYL